jgi:hypothetical protein
MKIPKLVKPEQIVSLKTSVLNKVLGQSTLSTKKKFNKMENQAWTYFYRKGNW